MSLHKLPLVDHWFITRSNSKSWLKGRFFSYLKKKQDRLDNVNALIIPQTGKHIYITNNIKEEFENLIQGKIYNSLMYGSHAGLMIVSQYPVLESFVSYCWNTGKAGTSHTTHPYPLVQGGTVAVFVSSIVFGPEQRANLCLLWWQAECLAAAPWEQCMWVWLYGWIRVRLFTKQCLVNKTDAV